MDNDNEKPRHRRRGSVYLRKDSPFWHISYSVCGRKVRENTKQTSRRVAQRILDQRLGTVANGDALPIDVGKTTIGELFELVRIDYQVNKKKSWRCCLGRLKHHLVPFFHVTYEKQTFSGGVRAVAISSDMINEYIAQRLREGASNGSINRELCILSFAFRLGMEANPPKLLRKLKIRRLQEAAPRAGFLEDEQFRKIVQGRPLWFRAMVECARTFAWRSEEVKQLLVRQVDLAARTVQLAPGTTKNKDGRVAVMTDAIFHLLSACVANKSPDDHVFTRPNGKPVADFRSTWRNACVAAGVGRWVCPSPSCERQPLRADDQCPKCQRTWNSHERRYCGALWHDWRRTGVRAMVRRGIPERVAMTISGHKTRSVFDRYNIVSGQDLRDAACRMNEPVVDLGPVSDTVTTLPTSGTVN